MAASHAAQSCFGTDAWPKNIPVPHSWLEFDVEDVEAASEELKREGYKLLVFARQKTSGPNRDPVAFSEGILVGVTFTAAMRKKKNCRKRENQRLAAAGDRESGFIHDAPLRYSR